MASGVQRESVFFRSVSSSMATMFYTGVYGLHKLDSINDYKTFLKNPNLGVERERVEPRGVRAGTGQ